MTLANARIPDAADLILQYLESSGTFSTIDYYDRAARNGRLFHLAAMSNAITQSTIDAANWIEAGFRRSYKGSPLKDWFHPQQLTAPWSRITPTRKFVDADPSIPGGEYDDLSAVWFHFFTGCPSGISDTQINKVLHQVFPELIPLFDSRLQEKYRKFMKAEATRIRAARES